jgi:DNA-directed RNA polymerase-3 subunit RPC5
LCLFLSVAKLLQFSQLATLLGMNADTSSLLRSVQQVAVLVQGNWIVRSEILYPKDTASSINGVPAEIMCRGRDYIVS